MRATRIASLSLGCLFAVALTAPVAAADDEAEASAVMPFGFGVSPQRVAPGGTLTLTVSRCAAPAATVSSALFDTVTLTDGKPGTVQVNADAKAGGEYQVSFDCKGEKGATSLIITGDADDSGAPSVPDHSLGSVPRPNSASDTDSGSVSEPGTDTEADTGAGLEAGSGADPRLASDSDATSRSETGFASDPPADSGADADADAGSHLASDSDPGSHPEPATDSGSHPDAGADKRPDTDSDSDKRPDTDSGSHPDAGADKRPDTDSDSDKRPDTDSGSHPDAGADKRRPQHPGTGHDSGKRPQHPVMTKPGGGVRGGEGGSFAGVGTGPAALGYALVAGAAAGGVYLMRRRRDRAEDGV
ncbi:MSCRAMM family adhesin SdrC [Streptomyces sp. NBC_00390]|uniref:hypothetical protein n=1 Tax=Streptomyces sp. NBC_00390 TaxID=2975736 RepID=UPI002E20E0ED